MSWTHIAYTTVSPVSGILLVIVFFNCILALKLVGLFLLNIVAATFTILFEIVLPWPGQRKNLTFWSPSPAATCSIICHTRWRLHIDPLVKCEYQFCSNEPVANTRVYQLSIRPTFPYIISFELDFSSRFVLD